MKRKISVGMVFVFFAFLFFLGLNGIALANNLSISNVNLTNKDEVNDYITVEFDISWDNSWYDSTNHDAVWIFVKMIKSSASSTYYHAMMAANGIDPAGTSAGSTNLQVYVPVDLTGAFIRRKVAGTGTVTSKVQLRVKYSSSPLSAADTDILTGEVHGIEMVYIPTASFSAGDGAATATLKQGSSDTDSWAISSEGAITKTNSASNGYYYTSDGNTYEYASADTNAIPAAFPKGYAAFYAMKYEITESQWVDFIQTLSAAERTNRDITSSTAGGKNQDTVSFRNTICQAASGCSGSYGDTTISSSRPDRAVSWLSWMDLCAYLDWSGLRPMTELEYEKMARGPTGKVAGEYAWGTSAITAGVTFAASESGAETISTANANATYNNTTFLGSGDGSTGPTRVGIYATSSSTRVTSGAGYYGVMDLSGNVWERAVTLGNSLGVQFTGLHGDGVLVSVSGYEGNANVNYWPHTDAQSSPRGVIKDDGAGFRGGSWNHAAAIEQVSDRSRAAEPIHTRASTSGGRGVRTYDGP